VYPKAACTLALTYRFRLVGGASAGAIAAAAAAEPGRAELSVCRANLVDVEASGQLEGWAMVGADIEGPSNLPAAPEKGHQLTDAAATASWWYRSDTTVKLRRSSS